MGKWWVMSHRDLFENHYPGALISFLIKRTNIYQFLGEDDVFSSPIF